MLLLPTALNCKGSVERTCINPAFPIGAGRDAGTSRASSDVHLTGYCLQRGLAVAVKLSRQASGESEVSSVQSLARANGEGQSRPEQTRCMRAKCRR